MSVRFVKFDTTFKRGVWINPANVCWVQQESASTVILATADSDSPFYLPGSVEEIIAKLQGESGSPTIVDHGGGLYRLADTP